MKSIIFVGLALAKWDLNKENVVVYWGQNSYGATHPGQPWKQSLASVCQDETIDVVNLSSLTNLSSKLPLINLSHHCGALFAGTSVLNCTEIGKEIKGCQGKGKTVLLSIGGANAKTSLDSPRKAVMAAENIWGMFLGGKNQLRPFGDAILDVIDLDLEGGSQDNYDHFLKELRQKFQVDQQKKYYVTAAPQCFFPDANLQRIMKENPIDAVFIQFYNNWCGVHNFNNKNAWNWNMWGAWASGESFNKDIKLFLDVPATPKAAGFGYVSPHEVAKIVANVKETSTHFGGVMLWDSSQNSNSGRIGERMSDVIKKSLASPSHAKVPVIKERIYGSRDNTTPRKCSSHTERKIHTIPPYTSPINNTNPPPTTGNSTYPANGGKCDVLHACAGTNFATCDHGRWKLRPCPADLYCFKTQATVYCDRKAADPL
ncbi:Chitinase 2 [Entomophthora muscae]|uniref:Chitinase 2 n=1 Tax=Entomophthora muscae TaxID=34485 RepID=A0ACC2TPY4_9FUNG|nr:Chitinase 2 [Entomophthora muscae]